MKYLMLIKHAESYSERPIPQALKDAMGAVVQEGMKKGILKETGGLKPTRFAHRIRLEGGKLIATDGPFTEAKEVIGGYAIMEFASEEEARASARELMELHRTHWPEFEGELEVRPM